MSYIGILDSGLGGVSTLSTIMSLLPNEDYIYVADKSSAPYGNKIEGFIFKRLEVICKMLKDLGAIAIVIACNTATNVGIKLLREKESIMLIGVEPAIKPSFAELSWGKILVLLTPLTIKQPKFLTQLEKVDKSKIILCPQPKLASIIEDNINNLSAAKAEIGNLLSPYKSQEIESVVLGCTHYCLVKRQIQSIFGAKVYDGNAGTAVRLYNLLKENKLISRKAGGSIKFITL